MYYHLTGSLSESQCRERFQISQGTRGDCCAYPTATVRVNWKRTFFQNRKISEVVYFFYNIAIHAIQYTNVYLFCTTFTQIFLVYIIFYLCQIFTIFFSSRIYWKEIQINVTCLVPYGTVKIK